MYVLGQSEYEHILYTVYVVCVDMAYLPYTVLPFDCVASLLLHLLTPVCEGLPVCMYILMYIPLPISLRIVAMKEQMTSLFTDTK